MKTANARNPKEPFAHFWKRNFKKYVMNPDDVQPKELHDAITDWYNVNFKRHSAK